MSAAQFGLQRRIVTAIIIAVLATSVVSGIVTFAVAYAIEDQQFTTNLQEEIDRQRSSWRLGAALVPVERDYIRIYRDAKQLPADLAGQFAENPQQTEFAGIGGRHYHVARFMLDDGRGKATVPAIAVAEVSRYLFVRPQRTLMIQMLIALSLIITMAMALVGWWLARRATAPLTQLARDVAVADDAVPLIRASDYPRNEIGLLANTLEGSFRRVASFVDRERAFTRNASHELRTPVAVIRGAVDVIALNRDLPAPVCDALRRIEGAAIDMTETLDMLLAVAREQAHRDPETLQLLPFAQKAVADAATRFPGRALDVSIDVPPDMRVQLNAAALQLILGNLVCNSFQHAAGSRLQIYADGASLIIADTGPGIESANLFQPLVKSSESPGSGLGLDIVKRLCLATGIDLSWGKVDTGGGTRFRLEFEGR